MKNMKNIKQLIEEMKKHEQENEQRVKDLVLEREIEESIKTDVQRITIKMYREKLEACL